jgi:uncharacterized membrane protein
MKEKKFHPMMIVGLLLIIPIVVTLVAGVILYLQLIYEYCQFLITLISL